MRHETGRALSVICISVMLAFTPAALAQSRLGSNNANFTAQPPAVDQSGHREWAWQGSESLSYGGAGHVRYEPGGEPRIIVTGDPAEVANIEVDGGVIRSRNAGIFNFNFARGASNLEILVRGVTLDRFDLAGSATMDLGRLERDKLALAIHGSGTVNAQGQAKTLTLQVDGSGRANLDQLSAGEVNIVGNGSGKIALGTISEAMKARMSGSGKLVAGDIAKSADLVVTGSGTVILGNVDTLSAKLTGSATVRLASHPRQTDYHILGSAKIVMVGPDGKITELARMLRPERNRNRGSRD